jgi:Ca2+-binding EF-hand superfamily protein
MKVGVFVLAAATALAPLPVLAHEGPGGHGGWQALQAEMPALFAQADANGDGSLSLDEFKTFKQLVTEKRTELMFQHLDANGDGKVTLDEINAAHAARAARRAARHAGKSGN